MNGSTGGESARQARLCLWIMVVSLVIPAILTPLGGDAAIAAWSIGGTLAFIFGVSGYVFRIAAKDATNVRRRARTMSGLIIDWSYSPQEWRMFTDAEWDRAHGTHFRVGQVLSGLFGALMGGIFGSWTFALVGAIAGVVFAWSLKAVNRAFLKTSDVAPAARMNESRFSFGETDFTLSKLDCHLKMLEYDEDIQPPVLELFFGDNDWTFSEFIRLPVPTGELEQLTFIRSLRLCKVRF